MLRHRAFSRSDTKQYLSTAKAGLDVLVRWASGTVTVVLFQVHGHCGLVPGSNGVLSFRFTYINAAAAFPTPTATPENGSRSLARISSLQ